MKALVLSGGTGSRSRPFSYSMSGQLVSVGGRTVLEHCLDNLLRLGITDVGIVVGAQCAEISALLAAGAERGQRVTRIPQAEPLGPAHCVRLARDFLGDDDFLMVLGDNILLGGGGMARMVESFRNRRPAAQVELVPVADPGEHGIAELDRDGRVVRLVDRPAVPRGNLAIMGVYLFTPAVHEAVRAVTPSARGELEITDAIQWLVEHGHDVRGKVFDGYWKDTGRIDDLLDANWVLLAAATPKNDGEVDEASTLSGRVVIEAGASIVRSSVTGPAYVGAGSVVVDSRVGPSTAIGAGCAITRCGIENSIVLDAAMVNDLQGVDGSVIGRSAQVERGVGEFAQVERGAGEFARHRLAIGGRAGAEVAA
ncbi:glucose-1-phosphate thymidylyltransferase [Sphaerisporangium corydalis]|uniref:Glucose-1-phosphate thymidylyltransferase n=1 Tax=Sphaerisporangium corydalis TaxID=1441875 RepID=A0ABV9ECD2_9ACTN|nr:glucose-1-phosphate thymidylyltransferase [Sphaerisporangium corydalis]